MLRRFSLFVCVLLAAALPAQAQIQTSAKHALLMDAATGQVLWEKDGRVANPPASMSKLMTLDLLFGRLKDGRVKLTDTFPVSERAWRTGGSRMFLDVGTRVSVENLIRGIIIQSGNDACVVVAEALGGTVEGFAAMMNTRAKQLGLDQSHFVNPDGLPEPPGQMMSALDLAKLSRHLITEYAQYYPYFSEREFTWNKIRQPNRDLVLGMLQGADGLKTGHTDAGGYGLIGTAVNDKGRRVVVVVNGLASEKERAEQATQLVTWGLNGFEDVTLFKAGDVVDQAETILGKQANVPLTVERDVRVPVPVALRNDLKVEVVYNGPVQAPIKKGDKIGTLKVSVPRVTDFEVPLVAAQDVEKIGFFAGAFAKVFLLLDGGKGQ